MKSILKTNRLSLFMMVLSLGLAQSKAVKASHFGAVDLWVDYIGTGPSDLRVRINLSVYLACEPNQATLGASEFVTISSNTLSFSQGITVDTLGNNTNDTLDQLCPNVPADNRCRNPSSIYPGFVRYLYTADFILPGPADDWTFVWQSGARNGGITNICQPQSMNIIVTAKLNNVLRYDNSTPKFLIDPIPYICVNQDAKFY